MKMIKATEEKVFSYIRRHRMLEAGDSVVAGISGGADSVCLLFMLLAWARTTPLNLVVVHVNHGLRESAGEDAAYVEQLCREQGIPFFLRTADVAAIARSEKISLEEAGRKVRYEAFEEAAEVLRRKEEGTRREAEELRMKAEGTRREAEEHRMKAEGTWREAGEHRMKAEETRREAEEHRMKAEGTRREAEEHRMKAEETRREAGEHPQKARAVQGPAASRPPRIAVAHNNNDRSETMLFHLFRGSGIKGLAGIRPVRDCIIRPLLCLERREIEAYLQARGIDWCRDATNASDDYTRNRIRHHILPYAEEHIVQGCVAHMGQAAELLAEAEDYLEQQTREALRACVSEDMTGNIDPANPDSIEGSFPNEHGRKRACVISVPALLALHPLLQKRVLHAVVKDFSPHQRDISHRHIMDLLALFTGSGNRSVDLPFGIRGMREYDHVLVEIAEQKGCQLLKKDGTWKFTVLSAEEFREKLPKNEYTKCFDYDRIKGSLDFRTRQTGDYFTLADGRGGLMHKSVKDYMIDRKIPRSRRDQIPLLAEGSHVLWLVGCRVSEFYQVTENTKRILQVQLVGKASEKDRTEEENGRAYQRTFE